MFLRGWTTVWLCSDTVHLEVKGQDKHHNIGATMINYCRKPFTSADRYNVMYAEQSATVS